MLFFACLGVAPAHADGLPIELWTRSPGRHDGAQAPPRLRVVSIDLDRLPLAEGARTDAQYDGASREYRFVLVDDLIKRYGPPADTDAALLHFTNGMTVPLPFRDRAVMDRLRPAIARAIRVDGKWTRDLPEVARHEIGFPDARPIKFQGNKLVVADRWHPDLRPGSEASFTPYRHVDTLDGIEFVSGAAYRAQFDVDPGARAGKDVYDHVCTFCHGARHVGAQFGWDFVEPVPVTEYRKKDLSLYYHVKFRAVDAPSKGQMMPALPFLDEKDAADVMVWLRALAAHPLKPYAPAR
jgi:hypothetical protein